MQALLLIAYFIAFSCAMKRWQFIFPPRLFIYDLLSVAFILLFFLYYCLRNQPWYLRKELKYFLLFQWAFWLVIIASGINLVFSGADSQTFAQYSKSALSNTVYMIFFTSFILFLSIITAHERKRILKFYVAGVIASCLYGLMQMGLSAHFGINLDDYIWKYITYHAAYDFDAPPTWVVMGITRGSGFPGVNSAATYVVTVLPFLFLGVSLGRTFRARMMNGLLAIIALAGLFVTMSRTGMVSFAVALFMLFMLERKRIVKMAGAFSALTIPIAILGYVFWEYISEILKYRPAMDYTRLQLFKGGLMLFYANPLLGVGTNNYPFARLSLPNYLYQDMNLHNSWLTILVELGIIGLLLQVSFFTFMIYQASLRKNILSRSFISAMVGLSAGAVFNQLFDSFYFLFFVVLFFPLLVIDNTDSKLIHFRRQ